MPSSEYENGVMDQDQESGYGPNNPYHSKLLSNQRQTSQGHFQDTRLIELEIDQGLEYQPGDVCLVQPQNSVVNVEKFLTLMSHLNPDEPFEIVANDENVELPPKSVLPGAPTSLGHESSKKIFLPLFRISQFFECSSFRILHFLNFTFFEFFEF